MTEVFRLCDDYITRRAALDPVAAGMIGLSERGWLAAREQAMRHTGFDLKRWHTAALSLGPIGLSGLTEALARAGNGSG